MLTGESRTVWNDSALLRLLLRKGDCGRSGRALQRNGTGNPDGRRLCRTAERRADSGRRVRGGENLLRLPLVSGADVACGCGRRTGGRHDLCGAVSRKSQPRAEPDLYRSARRGGRERNDACDPALGRHAGGLHVPPLPDRGTDHGGEQQGCIFPNRRL